MLKLRESGCFAFFFRLDERFEVRVGRREIFDVCVYMPTFRFKFAREVLKKTDRIKSGRIDRKKKGYV